MSRIFIDSNVLLDVLGGDPVWSAWSSAAMSRAGREAGALVINPIVYAEVSVRFSTIEELEAELPHDRFTREPIPFEAAFLAGKAYVDYRRRGGRRVSPLPDFFIGAHAAVAGYRLLTRDPTRFRSYFPALELIAP